jgi:hypothetical protein
LPRPDQWPYQPAEHIEQVFGELIMACLPGLQTLPDACSFQIALLANSPYPDEMIRTCWQNAWSLHGLPPASLEHWSAAQSVMLIDQWLDQSNNKKPEALLLVALQLHAPPPPESGEGAAALLLIQSVTRPANATARLRRPAGPSENTTGLLQQALTYGQASAADIAALWLAGLSPGQQASVATAVESLALSVADAHDLDAALGDTGAASGLLALASAFEQATLAAQTQIALTASKDCVVAFVIQPSPPSAALA